MSAALEQVRALGGEFTRDEGEGESDSAAKFGRFVTCTDNQGSSFGLHQPPA